MFFAPVRENLTLFSPFIYLTYCYLYAILVHLSDRTVFLSMDFIPLQKGQHPGCLILFPSTVHALSFITISLHIMCNKNLFHIYTNPPTPPHYTFHTFSPRTSKIIPTPSLLHDHLLHSDTSIFCPYPS